MCGYDTTDHPVGLTVVITAGVAFGFVIGTVVLDYIRPKDAKDAKKTPKKCKKLHVKPGKLSDKAYQQPPPQVQVFHRNSGGSD